MVYRRMTKAIVLLAFLLPLLCPVKGSAQVKGTGPQIIRQLSLDLSYVTKTRIIGSLISGHFHKSLVVDFDGPLDVLSTLEGMKRVIRVGNHYLPHQAWSGLDRASVPELLAIFWRSIDLDPDRGTMLITGADMDNLALETASNRGLTAVALVTAGVRGNAMRLGADEGRYLEPGTINIIILTNRRLSPRAMTRAMITATEAKTASLQDLDIRSSYQPRLQATGTGTDNLIVVQGRGAPAELTGGHSKLGELIAQAAYRGVRTAVARQNGLLAGRKVTDRLKERKIELGPQGRKAKPGYAALEDLVSLRPRVGFWLESTLALDDAWQRGWLGSLEGHCRACLALAQDLKIAWSPPTDNRLGPLDISISLIKAWLAGPGAAD